VWGIYEVLMMGRVSGARQEALLARGRAEVDGLNAWLDRQLDAREWMNGTRFGWGDVSVYPHVHNADRLGCPPPVGSALASWLGRMRERPSAARLDAEFAAWSLTPLNRPLGTIGTWKRLYKAHRLEWMIRAGGLDVVTQGIANDDVRFSPEIR
jgi:glutathione S-transferase/RNA polymerase-associated protein